MFDRFTDRAKKVMSFARQEAQKFNHEYIGTEHILLGLVQEGSGVAANVLKNMDIDLEKIRHEVEKIVKTGPSMVTMGQLPFTPRAKKVLELSMEEASALSHNYIGTEHLLLGLIKESEGIAAQVLMNLNVKLEEVREEVLEFLGASDDPADDDETGESMGVGSTTQSGGKSKTPARTLRRESPFNELMDGIIIGRRLLPGEYPEGIESVVDLTAEFPESPRTRQGRTYRAFPILDASPCTPAALEEIARAIMDLPGDVYIHCAEGHGRTALVATSLLLTRGDVQSGDEAITWVLERRPLARMNATQRKTVDEVAESYARSR